MALAVAEVARVSREDREAGAALADYLPAGTLPDLLAALAAAKARNAHGAISMEAELSFGVVKDQPYVVSRLRARKGPR